MQNIADFINLVFIRHNIDSSIIQYALACLNKDMKPNDWIMLTLNSPACIILKFHNGEFMNEGYIVNNQKVLGALVNHDMYDVTTDAKMVEEGISDLDYGSRFEGSILIEKGIPFGFGEMYDDNGILTYRGIMINWKRFGYGISYHSNGRAKYEGYWCDDRRYGIGTEYNRREHIVNFCEWYDGFEIESDYEGDGMRPLNIGIKHMKLCDNCVLSMWDISLFYNLESIEIGDSCYESVQTFKIDGLNRLKSLKIGKNSFTQLNETFWNTNWDSAFNLADNEKKSFHILNCDSLESIEIGEYSFSDFAGDFELRNLNSLQVLKIGEANVKSRNFYDGTFVIRGVDFLHIIRNRSTFITIHHIRLVCLLLFFVYSN